MSRAPILRRAARLRASTVLLAAALALDACGGGGGGNNAPAAAPAPAAVQAPTIATQPAAQSVTAGQSATFTVAAGGDVLSYQWQRDGKDIAGATGASYTLANAQALDNGASFTVVVKNAGGSVTSAAAVLKVSAPATATQGPLSLLAGPLGGSGNLDGPVGRFTMPSNLAASPSGTLYLVDNVPFQALRVITQSAGQDASVATLPPQQEAIIGAVDAAGNLYENNGYQIYKRTPAGVRTMVAGNVNVGDKVFNSITSLAVDAAGTIYVADGADHTIRKVTAQGVVSTLAGSSGMPGAADGAGGAARFTGPGKVVVDKDGNLVVSDDTVVRKVTPAGVVTTVAGVRNDSLSANPSNLFWFPQIDGLGTDAAGNIYVLSRNVRRIAPDGAVSNLTPAADPYGAKPFGDYLSMAEDGAGNLYIASQNPPVVRRVTLAGDISTIAGKAPQAGSVDGNGAAARFTLPSTTMLASSLYADAQGNVFVSEGVRVRKITRAGDVSTLALPPVGSSNWPLAYYTSGYSDGGGLLSYNYGVLSRIDANGNSRFLAGQTQQPTVRPALTDGVGAGASFSTPRGFIPDGKGNVYCFDQVPPRYTDDPVQTFVIRKIAADGTVTTLPIAQVPNVVSWFADRDGRLVMATGDGAIQRLEADNSLSTLRAVPQLPSGSYMQTVVAGDRNGNLYAADFIRSADSKEGSALHKITPAGVDTIIAGRADTVGVALGGLPGSLNIVTALAVADDGTVYIQTENSVLRLAQ